MIVRDSTETFAFLFFVGTHILVFFLFSVMRVQVYRFNLITIILDIIEKFSGNPSIDVDIDCIDLENQLFSF